MSPISVTDYHVHISNHERLKKTFQLQTPLVLICFFFLKLVQTSFLLRQQNKDLHIAHNWK
jgi:hypothetical protein